MNSISFSLKVSDINIFGLLTEYNAKKSICVCKNEGTYHSFITQSLRYQMNHNFCGWYSHIHFPGRLVRLGPNITSKFDVAMLGTTTMLWPPIVFQK